LTPLLASGEGVIPVKPGESVPADGYFVPTAYLEEALAQSAALKAALETLALEKQTLREEMRHNLDTAEQLRQIAIDNEKDKARIEIEALTAAIKARDQVIVEKDKKIFALENPPWYKSKEFWAPVIFLAGALAGRGIGF
jgi:hypothetical protein